MRPSHSVLKRVAVASLLVAALSACHKTSTRQEQGPAPRTEAPKGEAPKGEAPKGEAPMTDPSKPRVAAAQVQAQNNGLKIIPFEGLPLSVVKCVDTNMKFLKKCTSPTTQSLLSYEMHPSDLAVSYRGAPQTELELDIDFVESTGNFSVVIDGVVYTIPDTQGVVRFPVPAGTTGLVNVVNVAIKSAFQGKYGTITERFKADIRGVRLVLDPRNFVKEIEAKEEQIRESEKLVEAYRLIDTLTPSLNGNGTADNKRRLQTEQEKLESLKESVKRLQQYK